MSDKPTMPEIREYFNKDHTCELEPLSKWYALILLGELEAVEAKLNIMVDEIKEIATTCREYGDNYREISGDEFADELEAIIKEQDHE